MVKWLERTGRTRMRRKAPESLLTCGKTPHAKINNNAYRHYGTLSGLVGTHSFSALKTLTFLLQWMQHNKHTQTATSCSMLVHLVWHYKHTENKLDILGFTFLYHKIKYVTHSQCEIKKNERSLLFVATTRAQWLLKRNTISQLILVLCILAGLHSSYSG